ncbi:DUF4349 domain-containing protein [Flavobacterium wongokense]|uniref:DUF4349 domain-containing protein n=1 Tax=Flavobacterium wongokense TaxID=2910674 RepID=UPI001F245217|nr:DUF4349 domain-containing protein [Flavobacterium sp. WG47]MCF6131419.1 DUF4349 domain-containing protein [Flavobacterium sp. WG47]
MKTTVLIYSAIIFLCLSCKQADEATTQDMMVYAAKADEGYAEAVDTAAVAADGAYDSDTKVEAASLKMAPKEKEEPIETKIIKSGNLTFQTDDLDETFNQIQSAVKKYKAQIKNDSQMNNDYRLSRSINIRVPNQYFDALIAEISKGVKYFDVKDISSQDVTEEYIDVESRIKTKKVLEQRYLELLKKANKVSEMLEIEGQLSEIREEIEAKEGRLRYLQNKVSMSTLDITFYKPIAQGQKATVSYGGRIGNAIVSGFNGISNFFIDLLGNWPVIVTLVVLILLIRKRFKRKNKKDVIENQEP